MLNPIHHGWGVIALIDNDLPQRLVDAVELLLDLVDFLKLSPGLALLELLLPPHHLEVGLGRAVPAELRVGVLEFPPFRRILVLVPVELPAQLRPSPDLLRGHVSLHFSVHGAILKLGAFFSCPFLLGRRSPLVIFTISSWTIFTSSASRFAEVLATSQQERWLISACRFFITSTLLSLAAAFDRRRFCAGCFGASSAVFAWLSFCHD